MMDKKRVFMLFAVAALLAVSPALAQATVPELNTEGVEAAVGAGGGGGTLVAVSLVNAFSCDGPGAPCNLSFFLDLGDGLGCAGDAVDLTGLGWDLTIETVGASWLSEAVIGFQAPAGTQLFNLTPGINDQNAGTAFYSSGGIVDLVAVLGSAPELPSGVLTLEFYESFDDVSGVIDANYLHPSELTLEFECSAEPGACCTSTGCGDVLEGDCEGDFQGEGTTCADEGICDGACCTPFHGCEDATETECIGVYQGVGTACDIEGTCDGPIQITICHIPPGNPANAQTITIGLNALPMHLDNHGGDYIGPCIEGKRLGVPRGNRIQAQPIDRLSRQPAGQPTDVQQHPQQD
jgi:hypothetical protein